LTRKGLGVRSSTLDTYYDPCGLFIGPWADVISTSRLMSELIRRSSPAISLLHMLAHGKGRFSYLFDLLGHRHQFMSLFKGSSPLPHSSLDEAAPLLAHPAKPDDPICASPVMQPADFRPIRLISQGVSGKVFLVQHRFTEENFALKVVRKRSQNLAQVINERDALCKLNGICWFLSLEASMHDDRNFYFVTVR
jgi:hypothetical protein